MTFETSGRENTAQTAQAAIAAAKEKGISTIVVASNSGSTVKPFLNCGLRIVCVTHVYGFAKVGENELSDETRCELEAEGVRFVTAAHALSGAERAISGKFGGVYPAELIAHTLRMLGQGTKVCVEISAMALDAGAVPFGEPIVTVGGTMRGADTAAVVTPAYTSNILATKVHEIICKPYNI